MWVTYILRELRATHNVPALYWDNKKSTIFVAKNSVLHTRMKHVDTDCLFVRDEVQVGTMTVQYVPAEEHPLIFSPSLSRADNTITSVPSFRSLPLSSA